MIDNFARNHKLGVVFEGRSGDGQLLVCGFDLPGMAKDSAARQLPGELVQLCRFGGLPADRGIERRFAGGKLRAALQ